MNWQVDALAASLTVSLLTRCQSQQTRSARVIFASVDRKPRGAMTIDFLWTVGPWILWRGQGNPCYLSSPDVSECNWKHSAGRCSACAAPDEWNSQNAYASHLPVSRRCFVLVQQRASDSAPSLYFRRSPRGGHAGTRGDSSVTTRCPLHRPAAHRQRRRTALVLPLLGAWQSAEVSARHDKTKQTQKIRSGLLGLSEWSCRYSLRLSRTTGWETLPELIFNPRISILAPLQLL